MPGDSDKDPVFHVPLQPDGSRSPRLKVAAVHEELSLFVMEAVKATAVPGATDWLSDGVTLTLGFPGMQPFKVT